MVLFFCKTAPLAELVMILWLDDELLMLVHVLALHVVQLQPLAPAVVLYLAQRAALAVLYLRSLAPGALHLPRVVRLRLAYTLFVNT